MSGWKCGHVLKKHDQSLTTTKNIKVLQENNHHFQPIKTSYQNVEYWTRNCLIKKKNSHESPISSGGKWIALRWKAPGVGLLSCCRRRETAANRRLTFSAKCQFYSADLYTSLRCNICSTHSNAGRGNQSGWKLQRSLSQWDLVTLSASEFSSVSLTLPSNPLPPSYRSLPPQHHCLPRWS